MKKDGSSKPKMGYGGMHMMPDGSMMKNSMMKIGGSVGKPKMKSGLSVKMKMGGSVKSKKK